MSNVGTLTAVGAGIDPHWLRTKAAELARDIAMEIGPASELAKSYGLDSVQWSALAGSAFFRKLVSEAHTELSGASGMAERIRRKAGLAVEASILDMAGIIADPKSAAGTRISAFAELREVAGLNAKAAPPAAAAGGGPLIVINMPNGGGSISVGGSAPEAIEGEVVR